MVNITFTNKNPHSQHTQVHINLKTGTCKFAENVEFSLQELINNPDFSHPLFNEPFIQTPDYLFHYVYQNIEQLLYAGIYVYSRLIRTDKPLSCQFKIRPSPHFQHMQFRREIYFSINRHKRAQETILISQLETMCQQMRGLKFRFSEDTIIDTEFTIEDLPETIDGDSLYVNNERLITLLKNPYDFSRYELRYINPTVGFGVFSKTLIKKDEIISLYTGEKKSRRLTMYNYAFTPANDCLATHLDASQHGNIARFINHAPNENQISDKSLIEANVKSECINSNGIEFVLYTAKADIVSGEQLLVDYGKKFFQKSPMTLFKTDGSLMDQNKNLLQKLSRRKINHLKIMASNGVKNAQFYIIIRMVLIIIVVAFIFAGLNIL